MSDTSASDPVLDRTAPDRASNKKLPTYRVGFPKQLDALRAYAVLSEGGTKPVRYPNVGEIIKVHEANVSSMNPFFLENGFIEKQAAGMLPNPALLEYSRAHSWNPDTAGAKLAPLISKTWFGEAIQQRLLFRAMSEDEAVEALASVSMAGPDAKPQLKMLLEYCELAGLVRRENGQLIATSRNQEQPAQPAARTEAVHTAAASSPQVERKQTFFGSGPAAPAEGGINFQVSIKVDLAEMKGWSADRIAAFFGGMAQVLAAQDKKDQ